MSRVLYTFCPLTILGDFYRIPEKLPKSSADKMYRACETKDQTLKKIRTLHFPEQGYFGGRRGGGQRQAPHWPRTVTWTSKLHLVQGKKKKVNSKTCLPKNSSRAKWQQCHGFLGLADSPSPSLLNIMCLSSCLLVCTTIKWVIARKWCSPECTKITHRRSLAIFTADEGIARNSAARIIFARFHRRKNRGSLATFFAEEIAHLGASKSRAIFPGAVKIAAATVMKQKTS